MAAVDGQTRMMSGYPWQIEHDRHARVAADEIHAGCEHELLGGRDQPAADLGRTSRQRWFSWFGNAALKRVAESMNRSDEPRSSGGVAQHTSDLAHEHRQTCVGHEGAGPQMFVQFGFGQRARTHPDQQAEQVECLRRQMHLLPAPQKLPALLVQHEIIEVVRHGDRHDYNRPAPVTLTPGTRLGPYEIVAAIGRGGMGEVYRATDTRLKREIAIKVLPPHVTSHANRRQRFEREAQAIAAVSHPHICALFDVGSQDGVDFLVMEYLEGETLDRRLVRGALPLNQVFQLAIQIADALGHAHRHGIVHRDLKPANIMLTKAGAKLLDFGLAGWNEPTGLPLNPVASDVAAGLPETRTLTAEGTILGTLQYMAPEQLEGKATDARADLFAFGAVVYEMATGRRAFSGGSNASLIAAIMLSDPAPLVTDEPIASPGLERIVKKCLAKDPELRWQTARDLMDELQWVADGGSAEIPATRDAGTPPASIPARRRHAYFAWIGVGIACVIAGAVTGVILAQSFWRGPAGNPAVPRDLQLFQDQPAGFDTAVKGLGSRIVIDFEEIDAKPATNTISGRPPFDRLFYASRGVLFSNPRNADLFVAPGGRTWNPTNSLSVGRFPYDSGSDGSPDSDDDLAVTFEPGCSAAAFSVVDKGHIGFDEFVEFLDTEGRLLRVVSLPRSFLGLIAPVRPDLARVRIGRIRIAEGANDGDDVTYDNFICIR